MACTFNIGRTLGQKVCDSLHLFNNDNNSASGEEKWEDQFHRRKREAMCTETYLKFWSACKGLAVGPGSNDTAIAACLNETAGSLEDYIGMKRAIDTYEGLEFAQHLDKMRMIENLVFSENTVVMDLMFKDRYYTSIKRDVSYTFSELVGKRIFP